MSEQEPHRGECKLQGGIFLSPRVSKMALAKRGGPGRSGKQFRMDLQHDSDLDTTANSI